MHLPKLNYKYCLLLLFFFLSKALSAQVETEQQVLNRYTRQVQTGQTDSALMTLDKGLFDHPQSAVLFYYKGLLYAILQKEDSAINYFTKVIRIVPKVADTYISRGDMYFNKRNYNLALADFSIAIELDTTSERGSYKRGQIFTQLKSYNLAIQDYNNALHINPKSAKIYMDKGLCFSYNKEHDSAIANMTKAIEFEPGNAYFYTQRALSYQIIKNYKKAIEDYSKVIQLSPADVTALVQRGNSYAQTKNYDSAIHDFSTFLLTHPNDVSVYQQRGSAYYNNKDFDKALADYNKALQIDPKNVAAYVNRGLVYFKKVSNDSAIADFTQATKLTPPSDSADLAYTNRANVYNSMGNYAAAISDCSEAIRINPKNSIAYMIRGYANLNRRSYDSAIIDLTQSLNLNPNDPLAHINRAYAYDGKGINELALRDYNDAIKYDSTNEKAYAYASRGIFYYYNDEADLAMQDFNKAITLDEKYTFGYRARAAGYKVKGLYWPATADIIEAIQINPDAAELYTDLFTLSIHTGDLTRATNYLKIYKDKKLNAKDKTREWEFYNHYINAVIDGVLSNSCDVALKELKAAEETYTADTISYVKKNERKFGFVDILYLKGYVLEKLGKDEEAEISYEQSLVLNQNQADVKEALQRFEAKKELLVKKDKTPPSIEILSPQVTRSFEIVADEEYKTYVKGHAIDESGIKTVLINGKKTAVNEDGFFMDSVSLVSGKNILNVEATDKNDNKATASFTITSNSRSSLTSKTRDTNTDPGIKDDNPNYYAILIAEQDYTDFSFPTLKNPVSDARSLKETLEANYTFKSENIQLLENKSKDDIMEAIMQKCNTLKENDNLLIFYAGHGTSIKDKLNNDNGYLIPTDAKKGHVSMYVSSYDINTAAKSSDAKHILIIYDACYAGSMTRSVSDDAPRPIQNYYNLTSRKVMSSGNLTPVPDNSAFLMFLKENLNKNSKKYLMAGDLFTDVRTDMMSFHSPDWPITTPQYGPLVGTGDRGGEFVFIRKK